MKDEQIIMVVKREILLGKNYFEGFRPRNEVDYESIILNNFKYIKRGLAEKDRTYKQPISYFMIVNPELKQVFAYQRSTKDEIYGEKRLQGKWSWGAGGHIEKIDTKDGNPIHVSLLREFNEEVEIDGTINMKILGYINNDLDNVGRVHFGILYVIETDSITVKPKDPEIDNGRLRTLEELEDICSSPDYTVEGWSKIAFSPLKKYFYGL